MSRNQDFWALEERRREEEDDDEEESRLGRGTGSGPFSRVGNCESQKANRTLRSCYTY